MCWPLTHPRPGLPVFIVLMVRATVGHKSRAGRQVPHDLLTQSKSTSIWISRHQLDPPGNRLQLTKLMSLHLQS